MARETFTSLKATHTAHRMAGDILYAEPLHFEHRCPHCGQELEGTVADLNARFICGNCGGPIALPAHVSSAARSDEAARREDEFLRLELEARGLKRTREQQARDNRALIFSFCIVAGVFALVTIVCLYISRPWFGHS
jgi:hypothetical protein